MQLSIDAEFKQLIPALSEEEYQQLEQNIIAEGCRDALVVWQDHNTLIDGHNRYEICTRHNLPYRTIERAFDSREDVIVWMCRNQMARRNISQFARDELALTIKNALLEKGKQNMAQGLSQNDKPLRTQDEVAKEANTSKGGIAQTEQIIKHAPEEIKRKARDGDISRSRAYHLTQALKQSPTEHQARIMELCEDNDEKVHILNRLYKSMGSEETNGTFEEIMRTGGFHYGADMHNWCNFEAANVETIQRALKSVADYHRVIEAQSEEPTPPPQPAGVPAALQMSISNEWYTPAKYIDAARALMGAIDVDPASNPKANEVIQAATYYTIETDGFNKSWNGRVWLNPPYGRDGAESNQALWSARLIEQYKAGITKEAILLVNAVPGNKWFHPLWEFPICFPYERIRFYDEEGETGQPTHSNALIYMGPQIMRFAEIFAPLGKVVAGIDVWRANSILKAS